MCSVDKTGCEAIITQRALVFLSAVASRFRSCGGSAENFVVMLLNDAFHVIHTAVANFNCVFVENFVVPMVFRKVLLDQAQKYFSDVCLDVLTVYFARVRLGSICTCIYHSKYEKANFGSLHNSQPTSYIL